MSHAAKNPDGAAYLLLLKETREHFMSQNFLIKSDDKCKMTFRSPCSPQQSQFVKELSSSASACIKIIWPLRVPLLEKKKKKRENPLFLY